MSKFQQVRDRFYHKILSGPWAGKSVCLHPTRDGSFRPMVTLAQGGLGAEDWERIRDLISDPGERHRFEEKIGEVLLAAREGGRPPSLAS